MDGFYLKLDTIGDELYINANTLINAIEGLSTLEGFDSEAMEYSLTLELIKTLVNDYFLEEEGLPTESHYKGEE